MPTAKYQKGKQMFSKVTDLPCYDLSVEFQKLLDNDVIRWHEVEKDQICLNTVPGQDDNFFYGRGSREMVNCKHAIITLYISLTYLLLFPTRDAQTYIVASV